MFDIFIIGGGPAGLTAGIYSARAGYNTAILEKAFSGGQMVNTSEIENYPGFSSVTGFDLSMNMEAHARACGVQFLSGCAQNLDLKGKIKTITLSDGSAFQSKAVILCLGAVRRKLGCVGEDTFTGKGVSYCATCDGNFFKGKPVAVVGGGNTALEDALYLSKICSKVYLIHRRDEFRGAKILQQRIFNSDNIAVIYNSQIAEIKGDTAVHSISVANKSGETDEIEVSAVFCAVGTVPKTEILQGIIETDENGYIIAGEDCKTSVPGVFAAGDIRRKPLKQIITAAADGAYASKAAADYIEEIFGEAK